MSIAAFSTRSMSQRRLRAVALLGPLPLVGVAVFQVSLSLGARYGDAALAVDASTQPPPRCGSEGGASYCWVPWSRSSAGRSALRRHPLRGVATYEGVYKLTYVRGPSGIIVMLAEELKKGLPWVHPAQKPRPDPCCRQYVERRNGVALGAPGSLTQMLHRSLGADTFSGFWHHWNPIWGYYLGRFVNVPLRRVMPAAAAVVATFIVSGAIHDAAIFAVRGSPTALFVPWFAVLGLMAVLSKRLGIRYGFQAWIARAVINVALVMGALALVTAGKQLLGFA